MKNEEQHPYRCPPALKSLKCLAAALVLSLTLSAALPAHAVVPVPIGGLPNGPLYALAGITADQILRLTLVNVARSPAASCVADVSFVDETGMVRSHQSQTIAPGQSQIFSVPVPIGNSPARRTPHLASPDTPSRMLLRPIINLAPINPGAPLSKACGGIQTTLSVNDATTGQPLALIPALPVHPMNPLAEELDEAFPPTPVRYSFLTAYPPGIIHIHVTNAFIPGDPVSPSIQVKMGFQSPDGVIHQSTVISLMPGKSATLIQSTFQVVPLRPIISSVPVPISGIVTSVEQVDPMSARTIFFYPPTPVRGSLAFNPSRTED